MLDNKIVKKATNEINNIRKKLRSSDINKDNGSREGFLENLKSQKYQNYYETEMKKYNNIK